METHARNTGLALSSLLASSATLLCCVLPAVLISLGAGATLVSLVSAVPQLVWLSERKAVVFGIAAALLAVSGVMIWRARTLPCPVDAAGATLCQRLRRLSAGLYGVALLLFLLGAAFAYLWPLFADLR